MIHPVVNRCRQTLERNTRTSSSGHTYTVPDRDYYNHQWLWDSALAIEAWADFDPHRAADEFVSLVERGQWQNGMIPNMIITDSRREKVFWNSHASPAAPLNYATSGISQPPLLAEAAWTTAKHLPVDERRPFLHYAVEHLAQYHEWWYQERDFVNDGLVSVVHPYETGMDNNPALAEYMRCLDWRVPRLAIAALRRVTSIMREDTKHFPLSERADLDSTTYATLATLQLRRTRYDAARIAELPFQVQSVHTNSILARNNDILAEMAAESGDTVSDFLTEKSAQTHANIEQLWDEKQQLYFSRDTRTGKPLGVPTIASLMPLYTGSIPHHHASGLVRHIQNSESFGAPYGIPGQPISTLKRRNPGYWDGQTMWPFTTHLLTDALIRSGRDHIAAALDHSFLSAVGNHGASEYFSTENKSAYGTANFSPTASLALIIAKRRGL